MGKKENIAAAREAALSAALAGDTEAAKTYMAIGKWVEDGPDTPPDADKDETDG